MSVYVRWVKIGIICEYKRDDGNAEIWARDEFEFIFGSAAVR